MRPWRTPDRRVVNVQMVQTFPQRRRKEFFLGAGHPPQAYPALSVIQRLRQFSPKMAGVDWVRVGLFTLAIILLVGVQYAREPEPEFVLSLASVRILI